MKTLAERIGDRLDDFMQAADDVSEGLMIFFVISISCIGIGTVLAWFVLLFNYPLFALSIAGITYMFVYQDAIKIVRKKMEEKKREDS